MGDFQTSGTMPPPEPEIRKCACKKSRCLKLYCACFAGGVFCAGCTCYECQNNEEHKHVVAQERRTVLQRSPRAFAPKVQTQGAMGQVHRKGCKCRSSRCLKKYCECFDSGITCSPMCRCTECLNRPDAGDAPPPVSLLPAAAGFASQLMGATAPVAEGSSLPFPTSSSGRCVTTAQQLIQHLTAASNRAIVNNFLQTAAEAPAPVPEQEQGQAPAALQGDAAVAVAPQLPSQGSGGGSYPGNSQGLPGSQAPSLGTASEQQVVSFTAMLAGGPEACAPPQLQGDSQSPTVAAAAAATAGAVSLQALLAGDEAEGPPAAAASEPAAALHSTAAKLVQPTAAMPAAVPPPQQQQHPPMLPLPVPILTSMPPSALHLAPPLLPPRPPLGPPQPPMAMASWSLLLRPELVIAQPHYARRLAAELGQGAKRQDAAYRSALVLRDLLSAAQTVLQARLQPQGQAAATAATPASVAQVLAGVLASSAKPAPAPAGPAFAVAAGQVGAGGVMQGAGSTDAAAAATSSLPVVPPQRAPTPDLAAAAQPQQMHLQVNQEAAPVQQAADGAGAAGTGLLLQQKNAGYYALQRIKHTDLLPAGSDGKQGLAKAARLVKQSNGAHKRRASDSGAGGDSVTAASDQRARAAAARKFCSHAPAAPAAGAAVAGSGRPRRPLAVAAVAAAAAAAGGGESPANALGRYASSDDERAYSDITDARSPLAKRQRMAMLTEAGLQPASAKWLVPEPLQAQQLNVAGWAEAALQQSPGLKANRMARTAMGAVQQDAEAADQGGNEEGEGADLPSDEFGPEMLAMQALCDLRGAT